MSDTTPGGFADTPGPEATPEQDADVRALLALLRDEPLEMPPEVAARLDAVIAEERRAAGLASAAASPLGDDDAGAGHASVTVLPAARERRGPTVRTFTVVGGIAAAAVVVLGGIAIVQNLGSGSSASTTAGAASAPERGAGAVTTRVTASGATYTPATVAAQARTLAAISLGSSVKAEDSSGATPAAPAPTSSSAHDASSLAVAPTDSAALAAASLTPERVSACVSTLTEGDGTVAIAVDAGLFAGKAALLVVLPTKDDPSSLDVLVVTRDCSPDFLTFARIPRP